MGFINMCHYQFKLTPHLCLRAGTPSGPHVLRALVLLGALLQVGAKGAKFSMFKPAEEMVYIGLDKESRSKGRQTDEGRGNSLLQCR